MRNPRHIRLALGDISLLQARVDGLAAKGGLYVNAKRVAVVACQLGAPTDKCTVPKQEIVDQVWTDLRSLWPSFEALLQLLQQCNAELHNLENRRALWRQLLWPEEAPNVAYLHRVSVGGLGDAEPPLLPFLTAAELSRQLVAVQDQLLSSSRQATSETAPQRPKIFIGHGRSETWRALRDFLTERIKVDVLEFNRNPVAGTVTCHRLQQCLDAADFAFLIMTAEDERLDGGMQPRLNVVHEAGLFQNELGFGRAIVVREEGCQLFSNIDGLNVLDFPPGKIGAVYEEVRRILEQAGLHRSMSH